MRRSLVVALFVALAAYAAPALACEDCDTYYDWQALEWCSYCYAAHCGFFNCWLVQWCQGCRDTCTGDDYGCYEYNQGCEQEPEVRMPPVLEDRWRLTRVRVYRKRPAVVRPVFPTVARAHPA